MSQTSQTSRRPTVSPEVRWILEVAERAGIPELHELTVAEARAAFEERSAKLAPRPVPMHAVETLAAPGPAGAVPVRLYRPRAGGAPRPLLVWLHGGGHVVGSLASYDALCRELAARAGCLVASVDYRLAPEHPFPAAVEDAWAALGWLAGRAPALGADAARIAVGGDSAGGNLAAVCALLARDAGGPPLVHQLLVYPATAPRPDRPSHRRFATGHLLTGATIRWFQDHYAPDASSRRDWRFAPLLAPDLGGVAPALVIVAECDPLRDEGLEYARRLERAGVPVRASCYPGMVHAFFSMSGAVESARRAVAEAAQALREAFARP